MYWISRFVYIIRKNILLQEMKSHLMHRKKNEFPKILPVVSIEALSDTSEPKLSELPLEDGNVSNLELKCIAKLIKFYKPSTVFEIGTFNGLTTLNMAMNSAPETKISTLDLPQNKMTETSLRIKTGDLKFINKSVSGLRFAGTEYEKMITQIYEDSASFDYKAYENKMDFIFIDGSHSYEYVISDTRIAEKLLRNGKGIILWHDYGWREVIKALNEFYAEDGKFKNLKNIENSSLVFLHIQ